MPKIKVKGQTVQTGERPQTNGHTRTHTDATKRIISPATRSIISDKVTRSRSVTFFHSPTFSITYFAASHH